MNTLEIVKGLSFLDRHRLPGAFTAIALRTLPSAVFSVLFHSVCAWPFLTLLLVPFGRYDEMAAARKAERS